MDQRELLRLRAEANWAGTLVEHAKDGVARLEHKIEKCRGDLEDAKKALVDAKVALKDAVDDAEAKALGLDGLPSYAAAQAAEIKAVK